MADFATLVMTADTRGLRSGERDLDRLTTTGARTERQVDKTSASIGRMGGAMRAAGVHIAAGLAALASFGAVVREISEFETSVSKLGAISGATSGQLEALRDIAMDLGTTTEFSATQAADGLTFLSMAGFSAAESMAAIPAVLDLATASGMGLAQSADTASNIMSGFGIEAANAAEVADVLAAASSRANTDVAQLGDAMSTVAPIAATLEIDLADTAAAIGVLSDAGIQGARAGTAMRGVLASLAGPTEQAKEVLASLGLTIADVDPATNSLSDVMGRLGAAGLSTADAMAIFGREAASGALVLIDGAQRLGEFGDELRSVDGAAADMADTMRDNLGGDIKGLQSAVSGLILALGDAGLTAILRGVVQVVTAVVRVISTMVNIVGWAGSKIHEATNALFGFGTTAGQTSRAIDNITLSMRDEVAALDVLMGQIPAGTKMSREAATAKLDEARAIYARIEAGNEEARQIVRQSEAYKALQSEVNLILSEMDRFKDNSLAGGEFAPLASREGLEANLELLRGAVRAQQELLEAAVPYSAEAERAEDAIRQIEKAIAQARGKQVTFTEGTGAAIVLTDRLAASAGSISFAGAISEAYALGNNLFRALGAAQALAAQRVSSDAARARIAQVQMNTVGDPVARAGAVAVQEYREEFGDGGYGLITGGRASALASAEADIRAAAEAAAQAEINVRNADAAFASLGNTLSGGGGGGTAGAANQTADAIRRQISALEDAADPMRVFNREMAKLDELKLAGLSDGAYALAVQELRNQLEQATPEVKSFASVFMDGMQGAMDYVLNGFQRGWSGILDIIKRSLLDAVKFAIANPVPVSVGIAGGIGSGGGGLGGIFQSALGGFGGNFSLSGGLAAGFSGLAGGSGLLGGLGNTLAATFGTGGGVGGLLSIGSSAAAAGGGIMASIGAALPAIGLVAGAISLFVPKIKELDAGIRVTTEGLVTSVEQYQKLQKSRLFGLFKSTSTNYSAASADVADPVLAAVGDIQGSVLEAARVMGTGSAAFEDFTHQFKLSLKGLTDDEKLDAINDELVRMGDGFASLVPNFSNMNDLLSAANEALAETFNLGATRFEAEMLVAARRRGEITTIGAGPGGSRSEDLIRLQKLEEATKEATAEQKTQSNIMERLLRIWEGFEIDGVPRGPVIE